MQNASTDARLGSTIPIGAKDTHRHGLANVTVNGGTITGKAVCENLSRGAVSGTSASGPVDNPYAKGYSAGGSSSGTRPWVSSATCPLISCRTRSGSPAKSAC